MIASGGDDAGISLFSLSSVLATESQHVTFNFMIPPVGETTSASPPLIICATEDDDNIPDEMSGNEGEVPEESSRKRKRDQSDTRLDDYFHEFRMGNSAGTQLVVCTENGTVQRFSLSASSSSCTRDILFRNDSERLVEKSI